MKTYLLLPFCQDHKNVTNIIKEQSIVALAWCVTRLQNKLNRFYLMALQLLTIFRRKQSWHLIN